MTLATITQLATPAQINFLRNLDAEREGFRPAELTATLAGTRTATKREASDWISELLAKAKKPRPAAAAAPAAGGPSPRERVAAALESVECSKYAVPTAGLYIPGVKLSGDLLFLEVRTYMGRKYLNRLSGAPGRFSRGRFGTSETIALAAVIAGKHVEYARLFGEHYSCCGRCGAELTDQRSRETFLGPICRKVFGV